MTLSRTMIRLTTAATLIAAATVTFAPMAEAHGWYRRAPYRPAYAYGGPRVVVREHGGAAPFFAGLIGGAILGSVLHPQPVVRERVVYAQPAPVYAPAPQACPPSYGGDQNYRNDDRDNDRNDRGDDQNYRNNDQGYRDDRSYRGEDWMSAPQGAYRFEDISGDRWWDTFNEATDAARGNRGPRAIRIIDAQSNQTVRTLTWDRGRWIDEQGHTLQGWDD
jgi:hypothetical protein